MYRKYKIASLSECNDCNHPSLGDPVAIIAGGMGVLSQIFPNLFGGTRRQLTAQDWNTLFPGNGYWTSKLRNYLKAKIKYDEDLPFIWNDGTGNGYINYFVHENQSGLCNLPSYPAAYNQECFSKLLDFIEQEKQGVYPGGKLPGVGVGVAGLDIEGLLPYVIGGVVLFAILRKQKK
jgi:hypothetical protein